MFVMKIVYGPQATVAELLFKTREAAICDLASPVTVTDDFGTKVVLGENTSIWSVTLEDEAQTQEATIARSVAHARSQAKFQQQMAEDPATRIARAMAGSGAPIVFPGGRN